jgi:hypothetical protein
MNKFILIAFSLITSLIILPISQAKTPYSSRMSPFNLSSQKWKNRVLLVFAPSVDNANYQQQIQLLNQHQREINERDLLIVHVLGTTNLNNEQQLDIDTSAKLRQNFGVSNNDFRVILIGKDGASKRQDTTIVQPETIFRQIDAMPMRQQEMRDKNQSGF